MVNLPNALSAFRLIGSFVAVGLAFAGREREFAWLFAALMTSDWIDGKLAIAWGQQTPFGARLDSIADTAMYSAFLFGLTWMEASLVRSEWPWVAAILLSYAGSCLACLAKFGRLPSYHTRGAKTSWLLVSLGAISLFLGGPIWPLRVAAVVVVATNLEAIAITCLAREWQTDVPSIFNVLGRRQREIRR